MRPPHIALTGRERDVLRLLGEGLSDGEIAEALVLTVGTVKWYNRQLYNKLGVRGRTQAIAEAQRLGLFDADKQASARDRPPAKHNLPARVTTFVGRGHELAVLQRLLASSRLLTLTGPPGTGKTRLALELAETCLTRFADGVFFISLASIREPQHVAAAIAHELEVKETGHDSLAVTLAGHLRDRRLLLVLDNFEHLLLAAPLVGELLANASRLTVLATSREALGIYGEHEYPVAPLMLPDLKQQSAANIRDSEAVALFVQRAAAVSPAFTLTDENAASVAALCVHVDGLPLAIELAAARIKFSAPQTLLMRLGSRLEALTGGPRDLPARQRTLRATLTWSYDLLEAGEKRLFARLGIFSGGCTQADAEAVCAPGLDVDVTDGLESLVNKSLLRQEVDAGGHTRFAMLETMREYALECLARDGEYEQISERHARHFMALAQTAYTESYGPAAAGWLDRLDSDHDNLRSALRWALNVDDSGQLSVVLAGNLARFWERRGYPGEGRAWLGAALEAEGMRVRNNARAKALRALAALTYLQSAYDETRALLEEALTIFRELDNREQIAQTLISLGEVATETGDYTTAPALLEQGCALMREINDVGGMARALTQLGWAALRPGDYEQACRRLAEGLAYYRQVGDEVGVALALSGLGEVMIRTGRLARGESYLRESLQLRRKLGEKWGIAVVLGSLGWIALRQDEADRATTLLRESLSLRHDIGDIGGMAWCLEKLAETAQHTGNAGRAARLYAAAASLRAGVGSIIDPADQPAYEQSLARIRRALGDAVFGDLWREGERMTPEQMVACARDSGG